MKASIRTYSIAAVICALLIGITAVAVSVSPQKASAQTTEQECFANGGTWTPGGLNAEQIEQPGSCAQAGASITAGITKHKEQKPVTCDSIWSFFTSPIVCFGRTVSAVIGTALITISAWILQVTGVLFNWMIYYTVIAFGDSTNGFLTAKVLETINQVWTVFRDISNILIIGLFIFIALSIILGLKEFGQKKMIARVLIIAVLMNFSLLFTKMIIDASNFVAHQFYTASSIGGGATQGATASVTVGSVATEFTQNGIAGRFISLMGVTSIGDTFTTLRTGADSVNNGFIALLNGIFASIVLLAAAGVFFYGSFLLVVRAVLLVFLLITSSLAFATFLIPKLSTEGAGEKFGWNAWWSSLIRNAVFAPLLLMMLWVAVQVSEALVGGRTGSLGALLANPQSAGSIAALFNYIIVLGLLFAAIKVASSFSTSIGGFQMAAAIPTLGLAAGARFAAFAGRHTIGRGAAAASESMGKASRTARSDFSRNLFDFGAQKMKNVAKSDMNVMRSPLGGMLGKTSGLKPDLLAGKGVGGFIGSQEAIAHAAAEKARRTAPNNEDKAEVTANAIKEALAQNPQLADRKQQAEDVHKNTTADKEEVEKKLVEMHGEHAQEMKALQTTLEQTRRAAAAGDISDAEVATATQNIAAARGRHSRAIDEQTERIKRATHAVDASKEYVDKVDKTALDLAKLQGKVPQFKTKAELAEHIINTRLTAGLFSDKENARLAHHAAEDVGKQEKQKNLKESGLLDAFKEATKGDSHAAAPTPHVQTPPSPSASRASHPPTSGGGGGSHDAHH